MKLLVQAAFARAKRILNPHSTGAVLCGYRKMAEVSSRVFCQIFYLPVDMEYEYAHHTKS